MNTTDQNSVYLTQEAFIKDLDSCLLILSEQDKEASYYICEYTSPALYKSIKHIYIIK